MRFNIFVFIRRIVSCFALIFITLGFFGITNSVFLELSGLQFGQFFLEMSARTVVLCFLILLATSIYGRLYCSVLCPLGIFQDLAGAVSKLVIRKKYSFHRRFKLFHYLIFSLMIVLFILGIPSLMSVLDPYSIYIRGASRLLDNITGAVADTIAPVLNKFNVYFTYSSGDIDFLPVFILIAIFFTAFFRGRLFCNTICPVGMIFGCVSKAPAFRPAFNGNCVSCGKCEAVCKAECIGVSDKYIDLGRCVMCGNCAAVCPVAAMDFGRKSIAYDHEKREIMKSFISIAIFSALPFLNNKELLKRIPIMSTFSGKIKGNDFPQIPAGAMSWARLIDKCAGCHACIKRCPSKVLKPAGVQYGIGGLPKPTLNFEKSFCQYDCVECGQACPFGAIMPISAEEKHKIQTGIARYNRALCVITTNQERCGACAEHCPTGALEMASEENGHEPIPTINEKLCVGCGACESICPVIPQRAITVEPLPIHQTAEVLEMQDNIIEDTNDGFVF
ncbi:MAG: 4Fe-4S binding protein [Synergistaceae bacterium]|nr:4Fe-4S binding protein [Synergistaceae bacterium]